MDKEQYQHFWQELVNAEKAETHSFEKEVFFEGCMPVEEMASRGEDTLLFGPLKPVGLVNPHTGKLAHAVVQLRQDNADMRLTPIGRQLGLVQDDRWERFQAKKQAIDEALELLKNTIINPSQDMLAKLSEAGIAEIKNSQSLYDLLRRPDASYDAIQPVFALPILADEVKKQVETTITYDGYIQKQLEQVARMEKLESKSIPEELDYDNVPNLRDEAREKLKDIRPISLGQAGRISGVSPADISVLMIYLEQQRRQKGES